MLARRQGVQPFRITGDLVEGYPFLAARVERIEEPAAVPPEAEAVSLHLHVPAGATPRDGPSAGVAMFVALASLFADRSMRPDAAMTGEISLHGLVLPVGGIKDKVLAAQRAGVRRVLLPARNRKDLRDIPASAQAAIEFIWLDDVDDALRVALSHTRAMRTLAPS